MSHLDAIEKAVEAAGLDDAPLQAPLVALLRELARQMDVGEPSTRLSAAYLSALKDLSRAVAGVKVEGKARVSELDEWRKKQLGRAHG